MESLTATFSNIVHDPDPSPPFQLPAPVHADFPELCTFRPVSAEYSGSTTVEYLTAIINESLRTGYVPAVFKHATVCPIPKSGDPQLSSNYRPVSLLPICSKILERIVLDQLLAFFNSNNIPYVPANQFAYRSDHSCEDCLTLAVNRWLQALDDDEFCGIVFADLSKAFDRVKHTELLQELHSLGIRDAALTWFSSYLAQRQQAVRVGQHTGKTYSCTRGVPQGSVLGPILFCIYIREAPMAIKHALSQLYADDIAFYLQHSDSSIITARLNQDLKSLDEYLLTKGLLLNPTKTQFLLLHRPSKEIPPLTYLSCRDIHIAPASTAKYLGLVVDQHLSFTAQVEHVCSSATRKVGAFRHARQNLNHFARRLFYCSIIQSTLEYASCAYVHCLSQNLYNKLLSCGRIALKRIFGLDRRTPSELLYKHTQLYTLEQRINFKLYVLVYRSLNSLASPLLQQLFTFRADGPHTAARTRGQVTFALVLPRARTRYGFHSFSYLGADRWNALPPTCRTARSPAEFRSQVKQYLGFPVKRRHRLLGIP